jgi:hypothetical protein
MAIRISTPASEGILQVSKWIKVQMLLSAEEMGHLFSQLEPFSIFHVSAPVALEDACIEKQAFCASYASYVDALKAGELPNESPLRRLFSAALSTTSDVLYAMDVYRNRVNSSLSGCAKAVEKSIGMAGDSILANTTPAIPIDSRRFDASQKGYFSPDCGIGPERHTKYLIKPIRPVIQLQGHHFFYSTLDEKFHPMVLGPDSVTWGIQFSYPQIYQHPQSHLYAKVDDSLDFPNTALFRRLTQWMREHTTATPFIVQEKRTNSPIRLGKKCFSWIAKHPQLVAKQILVKAVL